MAKQPSSALPSRSALRPMLIGNLVIISAIILPLLPASIITQVGRYGSYGPFFVLFSGWQILTSPPPGMWGQ